MFNQKHLTGTFATGKSGLFVYVKRAMFGYENILHQETQILNAIGMVNFLLILFD